MTLAQKVAEFFRLRARQIEVNAREEAELNAIADVVEAGEALHEMGLNLAESDHPLVKPWQAALAKLAKAVGVEGQNNG